VSIKYYFFRYAILFYVKTASSHISSAPFAYKVSMCCEKYVCWMWRASAIRKKNHYGI